MLERSTLIIIITSAFLAVLSSLPSTRGIMPVHIATAGLRMADTLFHEVGHSIHAWIFGIPSIPAIMTLFGANKVSGIALMWDRQIILQIISLAGLVYFCYVLWERLSVLLLPAIIFTVLIAIMAISGHHMIIVDYMGHGTSIVMGGFFLFRAWVNIQARSVFERWLNGLFGSFLIVNNFIFSYMLVFDPITRFEYVKPVSAIGHHDFVKVARGLSMADLQPVAWFTMVFCVIVTLLATFFAARYIDQRRQTNIGSVEKF